MESLANVLYWLSAGLFVPVMLGVVIMFIYALVLSGIFYGVYNDYLYYKKHIRRVLRKADTNHINSQFDTWKKKCKIESLPHMKALLQEQGSKAERENILVEFEMTADKKLGPYRTLAKLAPILGLMGTLIPMGPALAGLGQGDVSSMAWNMQVAFSTTVIGLFSGTIGFLLIQPKRRIMMRYLYDLECLSQMLDEPTKGISGEDIRNHVTR